MSNITDLKLANLATLGYTGTVDDAELEYLGSLGCTGTLDDRRRCLYAASGFSNEKEFLIDKGYSGSLQDMQIASFTAGDYYEAPSGADNPDLLALYYNSSNIMTGVVTGTGSLTSTHTASLYPKDSDGLVVEIASDDPAWNNARWDSGDAYATDGGGSPLSPLPTLIKSPAKTNNTWQSNNLTITGGANWSTLAANMAYDQVGLDGASNTASTVTDATGATYAYVYQVKNIGTSTTSVARYFILKDSDTSRFPEVHARPSTGISGNGLALGLNTSTGAVAARIDIGTNRFECNSWNDDWWEVILEISGVTGNFAFGVAPAANTTAPGDAIENAAQGSCIVGNVEAYANTTIENVRGSTPVFTGGAAAITDTIDPLSLDITNHVDTAGAYYVEFTSHVASGDLSANVNLISLNGGSELLYYDYSTGAFTSTDGTNTVTKTQALVAGTTYKVAVAFGSSKLRINVDGSWGTEGTYDGAFATGSAIELLLDIDITAELGNLRFWDIDYTTASGYVDELMGA